MARSFNAMAEQLSGHFDSLSRLADVDREILASGEEARMIETLVLRAGEIYPCDTLAVLIDAPSEGTSPRLLCASQEEVRERPAVRLLEAERAELRRNPLQLHIELGPGAPRYLSSVAEPRLARAIVLPLLNGPTLLGLLAFCHRPEESVRGDRILYARQLADQFASALSHLRTRTENYALTHFDPLTGLPNGALFEERVREAVVQARRRGETLTVSVIDIDGFKRVSSAVGSNAGNRLLLEIATRLSSSQPTAMVARLGEDEFGLLLRNIEAEDDAYRVVSAALATASKPIQLLRDEEYYPSFSAGVAVFPSHGEDADGLILRAATALDEAKEAGGGDCRIYTPTLADQARHRLSMESQLRQAIDREELRLYYQPVVHLERGEIVGAEALLRWQHPERGLVPPDEFIPLAEETGLIVQIGEVALRQVCLDARSAQGSRYPALPRRLRHRLLLPGLPERAPDRRPQDRPIVHPRHSPPPNQRRDLARDHRDGPRAESRARGRGRGNRGAGRLPPSIRMRARAGVAVLEAAAREGLPRAAAGRVVSLVTALLAATRPLARYMASMMALKVGLGRMTFSSVSGSGT